MATSSFNIGDTNKAIDTLSGQIVNRTAISFTFGSSYQNKFSVVSNSSFIQLGLYLLSFAIKTSEEIGTGEINIGTFSPNPNGAIAGVLINNQNSSIAGSFFVAGDGKLYINPNQTISSNKSLYLSSVSFKNLT